MLKDQFPGAKYVFRDLISTEIKLPMFISKCLLNLQFGSAKKSPTFGNVWTDT